MSRIGLLIFDGVDDLDLIGAKSVFDKAAVASASRKLEIVLLSATCLRRATTAGGLLIESDRDYSAICDCDALVVPGGRAAQAFGATPSFRDALCAAVRRGVAIYSICSGAFVLAACGILVGRRVAVHAGKGAALEAAGDCKATTGLVFDNGIWSIGGVQPSGYLKSIAMAMLVLRHFDPATVESVQKRLELDAMEFRAAAVGSVA